MAKNKSEIKSHLLAEVRSHFLDKIIDVNMDLNNLADLRTNFLSGTAGVILTLSLTQIFNSTGLREIGFIIISITSLITVIIGVGAIRPKGHMKSQKKKNLMYYHSIINYGREKFDGLLKHALKTEENITDEYVQEIFELSEELKRRFYLIKLAADVLIAGLILGFILIISSPLI